MSSMVRPQGLVEVAAGSRPMSVREALARLEVADRYGDPAAVARILGEMSAAPECEWLWRQCLSAAVRVLAEGISQ